MTHSKNPANHKRSFLKAVAAGTLLPTQITWAKTYLSIEQAQALLLPGEDLTAQIVTLDKTQMKQIASASKTRVRSNTINAWKSGSGNWFIVDQIIGKHENIDMAFAISKQGAVLGMEVLTYRESYGHEVRHPKWRAQFEGRTAEQHLKLNKQIKNISGATLSCRHITDGVNRLMHTWQLALKDTQ